MNARQAWRLAVLAAVAAIGTSHASAAAEGGVRPLQPRAARLLDEAGRRSESMRALVEELGRSDVVVYVDMDPNEVSRLEGSLRFRAVTPETRYVRVWLQPRRCDEALMPLLAHELQHAVEVARAADVRTARAFQALYTVVGTSHTAGHYETRAAQEMTERVRQELARHR